MQEYPKSEVFALLRVERSSYYRWRSREDDPAARQMAEAVTMVFGRHSRRYGSRRIHAEMTAEGYSISRHRIRRVMASQGLKAIQPRSFVPRTTNSRHTLGYSPNLLLELAPVPELPRTVIVGDITYLPLRSGRWCYMATWTDLFSRRVLGWSIRDDMTEKLVIEAFQMMQSRTGLPKGCIIHSDRGGQYASKNFRQMLQVQGCRQSMSRAGETYDNAFAESLFSRYKAELLEGGAFNDTDEARMETFQYIDGYYNPLRRHSSLGYLSPLAFETGHRQRTENRAVFSPLTSTSIDRNSTKGVQPKQHSCLTF